MSATLHRAIGRRQQRVDEMEYAMRERLRNELATRRRRLEASTERLRRRDVRLRLAAAGRRIEAARTALEHRVRLRVARAHGRLEPLRAQLAQLSPLKILERGYAIVSAADGAVVKSPAQAPPGADVSIRIAEGRLSARITGSRS
jgi:exodeoxyribonuclease VII large subunit